MARIQLRDLCGARSGDKGDISDLSLFADDEVAYQALLRQSPADLKLVVIGGTPVFGEPALMQRLLSPQQLQQTETIRVCGENRLINVRAGTYQNEPWSVTEARLRSALTAFRIPLADFVECSIP